MPHNLRLTGQVAEALLNAVPEGALLVGADNRVVAVNHQLVELARLRDVDTSPGAPVEALAAAVAEQLPAGSTSLRQLNRRQFPRTAEVRFLDGRVIRTNRRPIDVAGEHVGVLWLAEDITEQRRREHDLRRHVRTLGELARERSEFTARASHELRTPLATILSFCELLAPPSGDPLSAAQATYLATIRRNAQRMQEMVDGLLHAATATGTRPEAAYARVDMARLLGRLTGDLQPRAQAAGIFLVHAHEPGPPAFADRGQLENALAALLDNAVKFTPPGGTVTVSAHPYDEPDGTGWEISVADTGIGIPKEFQEEVFTEFVRAPNARRGAYPGTGLGLSAVRDTVRMHDGHIALHGGEGDGTAVVLRLPTGRPAPAGHG
ncbi:sensor histidine kinase [Streptomyces atriruber]|uniref:sensor histidine kinase n=1 Tax=Streptomyces atriruber TaxID=545121 RepID=UPI0006E24D2D|nr:PAS domain-containing sensor histidine kinase [Streptomyces atriruber]